MVVPTSEVGYTPAMPRKEDHEVHKGHVVALGENNNIKMHGTNVKKIKSLRFAFIKTYLGSDWEPQLLLNTHTRCHSLAKLVVLTNGSTRWQQIKWQSEATMLQSALQPAHLPTGYSARSFSELAISRVSQSL